MTLVVNNQLMKISSCQQRVQTLLGSSQRDALHGPIRSHTTFSGNPRYTNQREMSGMTWNYNFSGLISSFQNLLANWAFWKNYWKFSGHKSAECCILNISRHHPSSILSPRLEKLGLTMEKASVPMSWSGCSGWSRSTLYAPGPLQNWTGTLPFLLHLMQTWEKMYHES